MSYHRLLDDSIPGEVRCAENRCCELHKLASFDVLPCSEASVKSLVYFPSAHPHATFDQAVLHYEVWLVRSAMDRAEGQVGRAATFLGTTRQGLDDMLDKRLAFANLRTRPKRQYRRTIITNPRTTTRKRAKR